MRFKFTSTKPRRLGKPEYERMHSTLRRERDRRWWIVLLLVLWVLVITWLYLTFPPLMDWLGRLYLAVILATILDCAFIFGRYAAENTNRGDEDGKFIAAAFDYLYENNITSPAELQTLDKRAEIGMSAGQTRTLFPLFMLPLGIPIVIQLSQFTLTPQTSQQTISVYSLIYLGFVIIVLFFISFSLFEELDRSNRDASIRHALAEYTNPATYKQLQDQRDKETLQRILELQKGQMSNKK